MSQSLQKSSINRIPKKSANACTRCRQRKIKCSGDNPCSACSKRQVECKFDVRDQRVVVSRGYLMALQRRARQGGVESPAQQTKRPNPPQPGDDNDDDFPEETNVQNDTSPLTNQLSSGPSTFMVSDTGRTFYLGTSSNWSFTRRVVCMAYEAVNRVPMASTALQFDEETYDLQLGSIINQSETAGTKVAVPSRDHAFHLVSTVQFHLGQLFHLYEESTFMENLNEFYNSPTPSPLQNDLWFVQFLLIMAFGKALFSKPSNDKRAPGAQFFNRAMSLLPNISLLTRDPALGTEILCNVALYLHCFDHRMSAYNYIGQAMRLALSHGMHTDMPADLLGELVVERCRRIWWTVFVLDCEMASLMGMPPSWQSGNMLCPLPDFPGNSQRKAALHMRIELSRQITKINATVYSADGRLNTTFLPRTKEALGALARLSDRLHQTFPLLQHGGCGISRLSAHLHLLYHQCIILATRPVLFCLFKMHLEPSSINSAFLKSNLGIVPFKLIRTCIESSQKTLVTLDSLQTEGLLGRLSRSRLPSFLTNHGQPENFLVFDLESLAIATTSLILATFIEPNLVANQTSWISKAWPIFDDMCTTGNVLAKLKRSELEQLNTLLDHIIESESAAASLCQLAPPPAYERRDHTVHNMSSTMLAPTLPALDNADPRNMPIPNLGTLDNMELGVDFSSQQLLDMADSIETDHVEWMAQTVASYDIW